MSEDFAIPNLPLNRYRLTFRAQETWQLPAFAGPLWRSVLGPQVRQMGEVLFQKLFETEMPPFIISTPYYETEQWIEKGECFHFELTLIGHANDVASAIFQGYSLAALQGFGKQRAKSDLVCVETIWRSGQPDMQVYAYQAPESPVVPPMPCRVRIHVNSPMCLKMKQKKTILKAHQFRAYDLFDKLIRRVSTLMSTYTGQKLQTNFKFLKALGQQVEAQDVLLHDCNLKRWSARQNQEVPLPGIIGTFVLNMDNASQLWPYLWLGQWTHVGKNTAMGCGAYVILPE